MKINKKGFVLAETLVVTVFVMLIFTIIYANFYPIWGKYQEREFFDDVDSKYNSYWMKRFIQDDKVVDDGSWDIIKEYINKFGGFEFYCTKSACPFVTDEYKNLMLGYIATTNCYHIYITKYNLETTAHVKTESDAKVVQFKGKTANQTYVGMFEKAANVTKVNGKMEKTSLGKKLSQKELDLYETDPKKQTEKPLIYFQIHSEITPHTKRYIDYLPAYKYPSVKGAKYRIIAEYGKLSDDSSETQKNKFMSAYSTIELKRG